MNKIRLVYEHWFHDGNQDRPFLNGVHPAVYSYIKKWYGYRITNLEAVKNHIRNFNQDHHWGSLFTHENLLSYYKQFYGLQTCIKLEDVQDDDCIYLWPLEVGGVLRHFYKEELKLSIEGTEYNYTFWDAISPEMLAHLRSGKIKMLINMIHDPLTSDFDVRHIEKKVIENGISPNNVILIAGNKMDRYSMTVPLNRKIKITSGMIMVQQAGDKLLPGRYPDVTGLGYQSDLVRPVDLNPNHLRGKKFICFNRQMRKHRYFLMYLALKHGLIDEGYWSFLIGQPNQHDISQFLNFYNIDNNGAPEIIEKMISMIPYELDTQHIPYHQKSGFPTNNYKKELYLDSYIHIVSETLFDEGDHKYPFFSEKSFHGIVNLQPFIYVGNNLGLEKLRSWGMKTFSPFIDESYDTVIDPTLRAKIVESNLLKFHNMTINEIHDWYYSIVDILIHNQETVKELSKIDPFKDAFDDITKWYTKNEIIE